MANGMRTGNPRGFNKGHSSKFREGSCVRQTHEEGQRTYQTKHCENNNEDEDNSPKTLNDKNVHLFTSIESECFIIIIVIIANFSHPFFINWQKTCIFVLVLRCGVKESTFIRIRDREIKAISNFILSFHFFF